MWKKIKNIYYSWRYGAPTKHTGFMCATDFRHELGEGPICEVYSSIEQLEEDRSCVKECGIVEVQVKLIKYIKDSNF